MTPCASDGPALENVTLALTVEPAVAIAGAETVVVTSASGETAVVPVALSGSVFGPWLVVVEIAALTVTAPVAGAANDRPTTMLEPEPSVAGIPVKVTAPLAGLYVAVAPGGSPVNATPDRPAGSPIV